MDLVIAVGRLMLLLKDSAQRFDAEVGRVSRLSPAELLCLSLLWQAPQTAKAISRRVRLTSGAITALVDRLERRGFVARHAHPKDRRKILIVPTEKALALAATTHISVAEAGAKAFSPYRVEELKVFAKMLREAITMQDDAIAILARANCPADKDTG